MHLGWPQHQVIAILPGRVGGIGNKLKFCDAQSAFWIGEEQGNDPAAFAGQTARHGMWSIPQFFHCLENALPGFLRHRPCIIQCIRDRTEGNVSAIGHIQHR